MSDVATVVAPTKAETLAEYLPQMEQSVRVFVGPGDVVEMRALQIPNGKYRPKTVSGFYDFDHITQMCKDAFRLSKFGLTGEPAKGVYLTLNPVNPALKARRADRCETAEQGTLATDADIPRITRFMFDADPARPAGISATDEEKLEAFDIIHRVRDYLEESGWPVPVFADSGNGYHLYYKTDLDPADSVLVKDALCAVASLFNTPKVSIDTSVFNPSRITKFPGTKSRKGDDTKERPHRIARLLDVPSEMGAVSREQLIAVAFAWKAKQLENRKSPTRPATPLPLNGGTLVDRARNYVLKVPPAISGQGGHNATIKVAGYLVKGFGLSVAEAKPIIEEWNLTCDPPWTEYELDHKLQEAEKYGGETGYLLNNLAVGSVSTNGLTVTEQPTPHLEPGTRVLCGDRGNIGTVVSDDGGDDVEIHFVSKDGNEERKPIARKDLKFTDGRSVIPSPFKLNIRKAGELITQFSQLRRPLFDGLLRNGEVMNIISAPKFGKSWLVLGMSLSVACGLMWLGKFRTTKGKVLLIDNELHPETLAHRLPWVAKAMDLEPENYSENLSVVNLRGSLMDLPALAEQLMKLEPGAFDLIILDAWYRLLPSDSDENSNGDVTALYNLLDGVAHKIGCAFVCVHHSSKGGQGEKSVTDVGSGAGAQARAPDTHLILRQHEHDNAVVVDAAVRSWKPIQPFCMRWEHPIWYVDEHLNPADIRKAKPKRAGGSQVQEEVREEREGSVRGKILDAYNHYPEGETGRVLREKSKLSGQKFNQINDQLIADGWVEEFSSRKSRQRVVMFRLTEAGRVGQVGQIEPCPASPRVVGQTTPPLGVVPCPTLLDRDGETKNLSHPQLDDLPDMDVFE